MSCLQIDTEYKTCSVCNTLKPLGEFYAQKKHSKKRGDYIYYNPECKSCTSERSKQWQNDNYEHYQIGFTIRNKKIREDKGAEYFRHKSKEQRERGYFKNWASKNKDKVRKYNINRRMHKKHEISQEEWNYCKSYFNDSCAYCGMSFWMNWVDTGQDLHKEHVDPYGANDISNCVPACRSCNSKKWLLSLDDWYNKDNERYSELRYHNIKRWLDSDYKNHL